MGQMRGVGIVFAQLFGIEIWLGVLIGGAIVFFYAGLGGMKGITYTQVAQYVVMAFAYTLPAVFIAMTLTGNIIPQLGFIGDYKSPEGPVPFLEKLNTINTDLGFAEYTSGSLSTIDMFCITAALMCGTAGLPHVIVRFFTVKDVRAVRKSAYWTLSFIAVIYLTAPTVGSFARVNLIENLHDKSYADAPAWMKDFEDTGQLAWVDKNNDGRIQYFGSGKSESGKDSAVFSGITPSFKRSGVTPERGVHGQRLVENKIDESNPNELWFGADMMVMASPYMGNTPEWVIGLLMAGCIAAALSTAAGLLLVLSTAVSHDLMKKVIKPGLSDREEVRWARIASFGSLVVASYFAINPPSAFVAKTVAFAFGLAASSFFPTLLMGIFSKRINKHGGISGMVCGISFTLLYIVYFQFGLPGLGKGTPDQYMFGISPEGIGTIGMLINFAVSFAVSKFTPPTPEHIRDLVESIRYPRTAGEKESSPVVH